MLDVKETSYVRMIMKTTWMKTLLCSMRWTNFKQNFIKHKAQHLKHKHIQTTNCTSCKGCLITHNHPPPSPLLLNDTEFSNAYWHMFLGQSKVLFDKAGDFASHPQIGVLLGACVKNLKWTPIVWHPIFKAIKRQNKLCA